MKHLFWKTYKATFTNRKNTQRKYAYFRGFTWDVVNLAEEHAEEIGAEWVLLDLQRIY